MNPARENILARVRAALRVAAPKPTGPTASLPFAPVTDPAERFRAEFLAQRGEIITDLPAFLKQFPRIVAEPALCGSALAGATPLELSRPQGQSHNQIASADLGVTGCECLIAQTGTIVVRTRAISVLPPVHLVIAHPDQLVPDLAAALAWLRRRCGGRWPDSLSFITGPSRTADIEKVLVMGAHGPKRLALHLV